MVGLPERLWKEAEAGQQPNFRTLAKAQAALAIAILTYMPVRVQNLAALTFDVHLFLRTGAGTISTLELSSDEVKNKTGAAFDIPPQVAKMLIEYRERIAPRIIGHRPARLFVNADGTPKSERTVAWLISTYSKKRAGIVLTPHQFRHLSARILLDEQPGNFEGIRQLLGHKRRSTSAMPTRASIVVVLAGTTNVSIEDAHPHRKISRVHTKVGIKTLAEIQDSTHASRFQNNALVRKLARRRPEPVASRIQNWRPI